MPYDDHRINNPTLKSKFKWAIRSIPAVGGPSLVLLEAAEKGAEVASELPFITYPILNKSKIHDLVEESFNELFPETSPFDSTVIIECGKKRYPISSEMQSLFVNKKLVQEIASSFIAYASFTNNDQKESIQLDFYCPNEELMQKMPVLKLISIAADNVCKRFDTFKSFQPIDLRNFCAVMYSNAFSTADDTVWNLEKLQYVYTNETFDNQENFPSPNVGEIQSLGHVVRLYKWMSKVAHACDPNLVVTTLAGTGELKCFARRPLVVGEPLSYSYLTEEFAYGGLIFGSRLARERHLYHLKFFVCECGRCQNDHSRIFYCPDCELPGLRVKSHGWECTGCGTRHQNDSRIKLIISGREEELELIAYRLDQMMQEKAKDPRMFLWMRDMEKHILSTLDDENAPIEDRVPRENGLYGYVMCMLALHHLTIIPSSPFKPFMMMNFKRGILEANTVVEYLEKKLHEFPGFSVSISLAFAKILAAINESLDHVELDAQEKVQLDRVFNFARVCLGDAGEFTSNSSCLQRIYSLLFTYESGLRKLLR